MCHILIGDKLLKKNGESYQKQEPIWNNVDLFCKINKVHRGYKEVQWNSLKLSWPDAVMGHWDCPGLLPLLTPWQRQGQGWMGWSALFASATSLAGLSEHQRRDLTHRTFGLYLLTTFLQNFKIYKPRSKSTYTNITDLANPEEGDVHIKWDFSPSPQPSLHLACYLYEI